MSDKKDKKLWKIDLNQSPKALIISRYGKTFGKKIIHEIQDSIAAEMEKEVIIRHLDEVFEKEIKKLNIPKECFEIIMNCMDNYETIGR